MALSSIEEFEIQLQNTLNHFYNPLFHPEERFYEVLGLKPSQGMETVRLIVRTHIEGMKPETEIPVDTPSRRFYETLKRRYLDSISQEETAFQLGMTSRNLRRIQQQAVYALALRLWGIYQSQSVQGQLSPQVPSPSTDIEQPPILRELEVLQRNSPGAVANLSESLERIQAISQAAFDHQKIKLTIEKTEDILTISIHPSVLDQILLSTIEQLGKQSIDKTIQVKVVLRGKLAEVNISASQNPSEIPYSTNPTISEMLSLVGGTQTIYQATQRVSVSFQLPAVSNIPILLIDDNPDFFHLFRRYTRLTRYVMHNIREGSQLDQALSEIQPQIIILDVLLPDVDGWQLLIDLQKPHNGQPIPVIICSAIAQKEMAFSLGARAFLTKPVSHEEFLQTLDAVV